jgi:hypothetical protein
MRNTSHHITSHHITSHHITSHHITSHHITSNHNTSHRTTRASAGHGSRSSGAAGARRQISPRPETVPRLHRGPAEVDQGTLTHHITKKVKQNHIKSRSTSCLFYRVDGTTQSRQRPRGEHLHGQHSTPHHTTLHHNTSHHITSQHRTPLSIVHSHKRIKARRITPCHITITSHQTMPHPTTSQRVKVYRVTHPIRSHHIKTRTR